MPKRNAYLDVLRMAAVVLVLGRHMHLPEGAWRNWLLERWHQGGWVGVDLFFVLSGFLVSSLLFQEYARHGKIKVFHFLARRGFKIYPGFWILVIAMAAYQLIVHHNVPGRALACELLFVQNYGPALWAHTWSLAVEEHFYILLAVLMAWLCRGGGTMVAWIQWCALGVAAACLGMRLLNIYLNPVYDHKTHLFPSHLRVDSLFFGVLLAWKHWSNPGQMVAFAKRNCHVLMVAGIGLLAPAFVCRLESSFFIPTFGFTVFYLGAGCLLTAMLGLPQKTGKAAQLFAWIGSHSYSIYLWHIPAELVANRLLFEKSFAAYAWVYCVLSVGGGVLMYRFVELPLLRTRERWLPSRAGVLVNMEKPPSGAWMASDGESHSSTAQ